jgi:outer membrane protein W
LNTFALRGTAHYYFSENAFQPYAGVGIGGVWTSTYQQAIDIARSTNGFFFALDPEIGALYRVSPGLAIDVLVRYQWTTAQFSSVKDAAWFGFQIGLASMF